MPRFGGFSVDLNTLTVDPSKNYLDPRIASDIVSTLNARGLKFQETGMVDTGGGGIVIKNSDAPYKGAYSPSKYE